MSGSQFQQFNEDLNKMLGSTQTVHLLIFYGKIYMCSTTIAKEKVFNNKVMV